MRQSRSSSKAAAAAPREGASPAAADELPASIAALEPTPGSAERRARHAPADAFAQLGLAQVVEVRDGEVDVEVGGSIVVAAMAPSIHRAVLVTARERGEPVLVKREASGAIVVVGALRTQATPGVDAMEEISLEADRIHLRGRKEITLSTAGVAQMALRAAGEIETYASRIVSRAEELHKIVGRMLRLN